MFIYSVPLPTPVTEDVVRSGRSLGYLAISLISQYTYQDDYICQDDVILTVLINKYSIGTSYDLFLSLCLSLLTHELTQTLIKL